MKVKPTEDCLQNGSSNGMTNDTSGGKKNRDKSAGWVSKTRTDEKWAAAYKHYTRGRQQKKRKRSECDDWGCEREVMKEWREEMKEDRVMRQKEQQREKMRASEWVMENVEQEEWQQWWWDREKKIRENGKIGADWQKACLCCSSASFLICEKYTFHLWSHARVACVLLCMYDLPSSVTADENEV